ncbi:MAG: metallophosphoesterase, partial [Clostridia bacterium]|nr:metallophosphoesterase [Clostridia bacterium]
MKFIHCADIHLDSKMETNLSSGQAKERKKEILNTFEKMVAYAAENKIRGIIIAGDMFDTARITNLTKSRVLNLINKN